MIGGSVEVVVVSVGRRFQQVSDLPVVLDVLGAVMFGCQVYSDPKRSDARGEPCEEENGRDQAVERGTHAVQCARTIPQGQRLAVASRWPLG